MSEFVSTVSTIKPEGIEFDKRPSVDNTKISTSIQNAKKCFLENGLDY